MPLIAKMNLNIASILFLKENYPEAYQKLKESITVFEELCRTEYLAFAPDLALAYANYGNCLCQLEIYTEAIEYSKKSIDIYEELSKTDPITHRDHLTIAYSALAGVLCDVERYEESIGFYSKTLCVLEDIAKTQPITVIERIPQICYNLSIVYSMIEDYDSQEKYLLRAEEEYRKFYEAFPEIALNDYLSVMRAVCVFFIECGEFDAARERLAPYIDFIDRLNEEYDGSYCEWADDARELLDSITFE